MDKTDLAKRLGYSLRHRPEAFGIKLDHKGWASVGSVLEAFTQAKIKISKAELLELTGQQFELNPSHTYIRARRGHSIIDLGQGITHPPKLLFYGTPIGHVSNILGNVSSILANGLCGGNHVHLFSASGSAKVVATRYGQKGVIFEIHASAMAKITGAEFFQMEDNIWITDNVPPEYLQVYAQPG